LVVGGSLNASNRSGRSQQVHNNSSSQTPACTPPRRLTRSSLKGTPVLESPSAQYADCITPGVKRLRSSKENTPEGSPSKRLKSTPGVVIKALANIQLSPAPVVIQPVTQ